MNEIMELQTNQVSFISGLMAGFSLTIAANIISYKNISILRSITLLLFILTSLLFVIALYIDVRLSIEVASISQFSPAVLDAIGKTRMVGTASASIALFMFVVAIATLAWLQNRWAGLLGRIFAIAALFILVIAKRNIDAIALLATTN